MHPARWLERFGDPRTIRRLGAFQHVVCRDLATGQRRLVIAAAPGIIERRRVVDLLDDMARQYSAVRHARIPTVDDRGDAGGIDYLALCSDGVVDVESLLPVAIAHGFKLSAGGAAGLLLELVDTLRTAHRARDAKTNRPVCLGAVSGASFVVSEAGWFQIIGWGYGAIDDRRLVLRDAPEPFLAWEASFGAPPSPNGDLDAVGRFLHSLLHLLDMPALLAAALRGGLGDAQPLAKLRALVPELEPIAHAQDPEQRSWDRYVEIVTEALALLEVVPDASATARELATLYQLWTSETTLRVARDGRWFVPAAGERVELKRRRNLCHVLSALAVRRSEGSREPVSVEALLDAAWPGERMDLESGRNRVRVAIATLRELGLREMLVSRDGGYLFDPEAEISIE